MEWFTLEPVKFAAEVEDFLRWREEQGKST